MLWVGRDLAAIYKARDIQTNFEDFSDQTMTVGYDSSHLTLGVYKREVGDSVALESLSSAVWHDLRYHKATTQG